MKKILYFLTIVVFMTHFTACPEEMDLSNKIEIKNNSQDTIIPYGPLWQYKTIKNMPNGFTKYNIEDNTILPNLSKNFWGFDYSADSSIVYYVFIFDRHTIETVPWDTIRKYNMVLKQFGYTFEQYDSLNWTITYP